MEINQNYINHIAFVLDASASMGPVANQLIKVADAEIAHLARRSKELDQETRVSAYTFNHDVKCVIFDKDVLRLPSIKNFYQTGGMTALIDAALEASNDLSKTAQMHGDHAFLIYVLTDGEENASCAPADKLSSLIKNFPDNWTVAFLVPNLYAKHEAKRLGLPADNIAVWDATTTHGVEEGFVTTIRNATESFMTGRSMGVRGSKTIFAAGADQINRANIKAKLGFTQLPRDSYRLIDVREISEIRPFIEREMNLPYVVGSAYYQLMKPEKIQPQKKICVRNRRSGRVYVGDNARQLLGLPDHEVRVKPEENAEFQVFVQSTSVNRKLMPNTKLLVLLNV